MKARVDGTLCQGHGLCTLNAPDYFRLEPGDVARTAALVVPAELEDAVRIARDACPEEAISIIEASDPHYDDWPDPERDA